MLYTRLNVLSLGLITGALVYIVPNYISLLVVAIKLILKFFHLLSWPDWAWKYRPEGVVLGFEILRSKICDGAA